MRKLLKMVTPSNDSVIFRLIMWSICIILLLVLFNVYVIDRFSLLSFIALVIPYLISFQMWFILGQMLKPKRKWWWIVFPVLFVPFFKLSLITSFMYYYKWLPNYGIVFFLKEMRAPNAQFMAKVGTANIFFLVIFFIDTLYIDKVSLRIQLRRMNSKLELLKDNSALSVHFIKSLLEIAMVQPLKSFRKTLKFFKYVLTNLSQGRAYVSLREEWSQVLSLSLLAGSTRKFVISGEGDLSIFCWNRSVPSLTLLTIIENAILHSPANRSKPILINWSFIEGEPVLEISNSIAQSARNDGTGIGLKLAEKLMVLDHKNRITLTYKIHDHIFIVLLHFKN